MIVLQKNVFWLPWFQRSPTHPLHSSWLSERWSTYPCKTRYAFSHALVSCPQIGSLSTIDGGIEASMKMGRGSNAEKSTFLSALKRSSGMPLIFRLAFRHLSRFTNTLSSYSHRSCDFLKVPLDHVTAPIELLKVLLSTSKRHSPLADSICCHG